jgi:hypothetical protein
MTTNNSINRRTQDLTIDGRTPVPLNTLWIQYDINNTHYFRVGMSENLPWSSNFAIGLDDNLQANYAFKITDAGECLMQYQPSFCAYNQTTDNNVTGDGTVYTIIPNEEVWDLANNFNAPTFTAPISGRYHFSGTVYLLNINASHADVVFKIVATSRELVGNGYSLTAGTQAGMQYWVVSGYIDMDAYDTAHLTIQVSGSTKTVDVYGESPNLITSFSGTLIC